MSLDDSLLHHPLTMELLAFLRAADDQDAGLAYVDLPSHLCNDDGLWTEWAHANLIEILRRNHSHNGGRLTLESGWNVAKLLGPDGQFRADRKRVRQLLEEIKREPVEPEIRHRVRLTSFGEIVASRLRRESLTPHGGAAIPVTTPTGQGEGAGALGTSAQPPANGGPKPKKKPGPKKPRYDPQEDEQRTKEWEAAKAAGQIRRYDEFDDAKGYDRGSTKPMVKRHKERMRDLQ